jgi:hypothetical protein
MMTFNLSDQDIDSITKDAKQFGKEFNEGRKLTPRVPFGFLGKGSYIFRLYPDRDANGRTRILKRLRVHTKLHISSEKAVRCVDDPRVATVIANLEKAGVTHLWGNPLYRYKAQITRFF